MSGLRVIAGEYRGRGLRAPAGRETRPTSDRVREAVFSMLGDLSGLRVLDLFAGSGALGIEAVSRGAGPVSFVDVRAPALAAVRHNLDTLGIEAEVLLGDAYAHLDAAARGRRQYDLVFLDPPYRLAIAAAARLAAVLPPVLAPGARVVAESDRRTPLRLPMPIARERTYGDTLITMYAAT